MHGSKLRSHSTSPTSKAQRSFDTRTGRLLDTSTECNASRAAFSTEGSLRNSTPQSSRGFDIVARGSQGAGRQQHRVKLPHTSSSEEENSPCLPMNGQATEAKASHKHNQSSPLNATTRVRVSHAWQPDGRGKSCKVRGCFEPPTYSFDGRRPAVRCGNHRETKMYRVEHLDKACREEGCDEAAEVRYMSQDGRIGRFCVAHKPSAVVPGSEAHCQYEECVNEARYGTNDGPFSFCNDHKRSGMYTHRNGQLVVATRDGSAFKEARQRSEAVGDMPDLAVTEGTGAPLSNGEDTPTVDAPDVKTRCSSGQASKTMIRKRCQVSGCEIQPSYGFKGTRKAIVCTNHKGSGMVALKNRPCIFEGCDTRPHYGFAGGRPVYCVHHREPGMVHILKEGYNRLKKEAARKRAESKQRREVEKAKNGSHSTPEEAAERHTVAVSTQNNNDDQVQQGASCSGPESTTPVVKDRPTKRVAKQDQNAFAPAALKQAQSAPRPTASQQSHPSPVPAASTPSSQTTLISTSDTQETVKPAEKPESPSGSRATAQRPLPASGADTPEETGPEEVITLKAARESARDAARVAAEASGSGRRARAPSLKALEASGLATGEGAQLMSKEMKKEQARRAREYKQLRKVLAAERLAARQDPGPLDAGDGTKPTRGRPAKVKRWNGSAGNKAGNVAAVSIGGVDESIADQHGSLPENVAGTDEATAGSKGLPETSNRSRDDGNDGEYRDGDKKKHASKPAPGLPGSGDRVKPKRGRPAKIKRGNGTARDKVGKVAVVAAGGVDESIANPHASVSENIARTDDTIAEARGPPEKSKRSHDGCDDATYHDGHEEQHVSKPARGPLGASDGTKPKRGRPAKHRQLVRDVDESIANQHRSLPEKIAGTKSTTADEKWQPETSKRPRESDDADKNPHGDEGQHASKPIPRPLGTGDGTKPKRGRPAKIKRGNETRGTNAGNDAVVTEGGVDNPIADQHALISENVVGTDKTTAEVNWPLETSKRSSGGDNHGEYRDGDEEQHASKLAPGPRGAGDVTKPKRGRPPKAKRPAGDVDKPVPDQHRSFSENVAGTNKTTADAKEPLEISNRVQGCDYHDEHRDGDEERHASKPALGPLGDDGTKPKRGRPAKNKQPARDVDSISNQRRLLPENVAGTNETTADASVQPETSKCARGSGDGGKNPHGDEKRHASKPVPGSLGTGDGTKPKRGRPPKVRHVTGNFEESIVNKHALVSENFADTNETTVDAKGPPESSNSPRDSGDDDESRFGDEDPHASTPTPGLLGAVDWTKPKRGRPAKVNQTMRVVDESIANQHILLPENVAETNETTATPKVSPETSKRPRDSGDDGEDRDGMQEQNASNVALGPVTAVDSTQPKRVRPVKSKQAAGGVDELIVKQRRSLSENAVVPKESSADATGAPETSKGLRDSCDDGEYHYDDEEEQYKKHKHEQSSDAEVKRRRGVASEQSNQTVCSSEDCSAVATHGINSTARYCKDHRLFGMYEILQSG